LLFYCVLTGRVGFGGLKNKGFSAENFALKRQKAAFLPKFTRKRTFVGRNYSRGLRKKATKKAGYFGLGKGNFTGF